MDLNWILSFAIEESTKNIIKSISKKKLISSLVTKILEDTKNKHNNKEIKTILECYTDRCFETNVFMNTIVFKNSRKLIYDLYIPLTIVKEDMFSSIKENYIIENSVLEVLNKYQKILIVDNAGMGKSTLIKYLLTQTILEQVSIPIIIELRNLNKDTNIIEYIKQQVELPNKNLEITNLKSILCDMKFIIFFDGYDEISDIDKKGVTKMIQDFMEKFDNQYIITSREDNALNGFGDFTRFSIKPLNITETFNLIKKYDNNGETSKLLIKELNTNNNLKLLNEFLGNPLMVSLLYMTYRRVENIPKEKIEFYNQVYNALYEEHDLTKKGAYKRQKKSQISKMDFKRISNALGFLSVQANKVSFLEDELFNLLKKAIGLNCDIKVEASDIMNDIIEAVPFFIKEDTHIRWIHKSFSEYFAANLIAFDIKEDKKKEILGTIINHEGNEIYINVLDFYFDLDKKCARQFIIYKIVSEYIEFYNKSYQHDIFKNYPIEFLDLRRNLDFVKRSILERLENDPKSNEYILVKEIYPRRNIIEILYNKHVDIFKSTTSYTFNHIEDIEDIEYMEAILICSLEKDLKDLNYIVNDEANNILNDLKHFNKISDCMYDTAKNYELLDYCKCLELKNTIEQEIENENKLIFIDTANWLI